MPPYPEAVSDAPPQVSVVLTTKDRPAGLQRALASALAQHDVPVEVVVVDDGSQPPAQVPADPRVRVIRHEQARGACAARNAGLAVADGRWVTFLDDDDELTAGSLARALDVLEHSGRTDLAVLSTVTTVDDASGARSEHVPHDAAKGADWLAVPRFDGTHAHNSLVAPTEVLRRLGGFDPALSSWEHDELFLRLLLEVELRAIPTPGYLMHEDFSRPSLRKAYEKNATGILATLQRHDDLHGADSRVTADSTAVAAWNYARAGNWPAARRWFRVSLRAEPTRTRTWVRLAYAASGDQLFRATRPLMRWRRARLRGSSGALS